MAFKIAPPTSWGIVADTSSLLISSDGSFSTGYAVYTSHEVDALKEENATLKKRIEELEAEKEKAGPYKILKIELPWLKKNPA